MASSPETGSPPENIATSSPPPPPASPPHLQGGKPSLTTAAQPEPAPPDHATPTPPPPPEQDAEKPPDEDEPLTPPIDGASDGAGPPPSLSQKLVALASPALQAASLEEPTSASPPPPSDAAKVSPMGTTAVASIPPSPQIAEALPEEAPPPLPPPTLPAPTSGSCLDAFSTDAVAMASDEAPGPPPVPESMGTGTGMDRHTTSAPPASPLERAREIEGLLPQQHTPFSCLETAPPGSDDSETLQLPPHPAETAHALPDTAEIDTAAVTSVEAAGSTRALEATDGKTGATHGVLLELKSDVQRPLQEPAQRPPSPTMEDEPCSPEMAPPGFENFKSSWLPPPPCSLPAKSTHFLLDSVATKAVVMPEEPSGSLPALEAMDIDTNTVPSLSPPSSERLLQQSLLKPPSPNTQAEPCSPDTPPPGFENFKSSWLLPTTLPFLAKTTCALPEVVTTKAVPMTGDEAGQPVPALKMMDTETETDAAQSLLRQSSSVTQSAPCSPEMAPPGFENFKSSWPPLPPPSHTPHALPDAVANEALPVILEKAAELPPVLEAMDVDINTTHPIQAPLESGVEGLLQELLPRSSSPRMQDAPCSLDLAPPGFENFKSSQPLLPSLPLVQTAYTLHDLATAKAVSVTEEVPQTTPIEAMENNMDMASALLPSSGSGAEGALPQKLPQLPSSMEKSTSCSPDMASSGYENLDSSQLLTQSSLLPSVQIPDASVEVSTTVVTVVLEEACHPLPVSSAMEEGTIPLLPLPPESGSEGSLPQSQVESQLHSSMEKAVDTLLDASTTKSVAMLSEEIIQSAPALQTTETSMDSTTAVLPLSESGEDEQLEQAQHQPSSPTVHNEHCSPDSLQLPPPPPPCLDKDMAQLVCGTCRVLLAYARGSAHVQCSGCWTVNLVLEAHEVGKVYCGRCETFLMYPFGAPAVKCSWCLFVTEIGERNVRPRTSIEQAASPHPHKS